MKKKLVSFTFCIPNILILLIFIIFSGCKNQKSQLTNLQDEKVKEVLQESIELFKINYSKLISENEGDTTLPSGCNSEGLQKVEPRSWVSGFFPGSLWYLYELTNEEYWKEHAEKYTSLLTEEQFNKGTHDLGFMMFNSFGNGYRLTGNQEYEPVLLESAKSLASRFNENTGVIKSWDFWGWWEQYPVIVDNMMNLELLMWASEHSNNDFYKEVAMSHSKTTIENHFFDEKIAFHVVDYDTITGEVLSKGTFQGYADSSAWARGQAWALYGFTYMYKETQQDEFLDKAKQIASFILNNLPEDYVPYWDFLAPNIPDEPRDASAASIIASALIDLSQLTENESSKYLEQAENILMSLQENYFFEPEENGCGFLIKHCVVSKPHNAGVDVSLNYADYYYLEACKRYFDLGKV